ncbi:MULTISPECIES: DMT family transporter [Kaistia]|uniref:DMT family transporter n=1 Tax=Kaistia nematophila TaxID=2994654 RepID=A0A9X3DZR0_9HYPH|nr:DMT family transporter [Kaistia nematophila]MCX5567862.1 DMT family transporter [Kaistia nematophila]
MSATSPAATVRPLSGPLLGIALMVLGILLYSVNDTLGKWLVGTYSVGMILLIRSLAALLVMLPVICRDNGVRQLAKAPRPWMQLLRVGVITGEIGFFYWAVSLLPLADVMTYYLAGPIYVTALSALLLKEKVDGPRWAAILAGFVGVLIVLQPSSDSLSWGALIAIGGSLFFAALMIVTRQLRGTPDKTLLTFSTVSTLLVGAVIAPFSWVTPTTIDFGLLGLLGVVALMAQFCVTRSLKLAPASVVVPYQYTMLIWAVVFGYFVFGDQPKVSMLIGAAIIIASGLFIFMREQRETRNKAGETIAEEVGDNVPG